MKKEERNEIHNNENWANPINGDLQFDFKDVRHQYYDTVSVLNCREILL